MTTKEIKLMIIENFIDWHTTNEEERNIMKENAKQYVNEDWVDEIAQSESTKKSYIIVDEQNRWQSTGYDMTDDEIKQDVEELKERLEDDGEGGIDLLLFEIKGRPTHV